MRLRALRTAPVCLLLAAFAATFGITVDAHAADDALHAGYVGRSLPPTIVPLSSTPVDLEFRNPTSVRDIYRSLGQAFGLTVIFDPRLKDMQVSLEADGLTAQEAFTALSQSAGHMYKALDENTVLVAADTPQNRRSYEAQVARLFVLENAEMKNVMTTLRSLVSLKHISTVPTHNALLVRDSAARVAVAQRLVELSDRPAAEMEVDVELLLVDGDRLDKALVDGSESTQRLSRERLARFKGQSGARSLYRSSLSLEDGGEAKLRIQDVQLSNSDLSTGLELNIRARVHPSTRDASLELGVRTSYLQAVPAKPSERPTLASRSLESELRLGAGHSYLLTGLLETTGSAEAVRGDATLADLFAGRVREGQEAILVLTPRLIRESGLGPEDLQAFILGTESNLEIAPASGGLGKGSGKGKAEGFGPEGSAEQEALRERLRKRLAELPRGLEAKDED